MKNHELFGVPDELASMEGLPAELRIAIKAAIAQRKEQQRWIEKERAEIRTMILENPFAE